MSYFQSRNDRVDGPPPYGSSIPSGQPSGKSGRRTMQVMVNLTTDQSVEVKLNADSPWMVGIVLAVLHVAEKNYGVQYEIQYKAGNRTLTGVFAGNSPNIRVQQ